MRSIIFTLLVLFAGPAAAQTSDAELRQLVQRAAQAIENPGDQADRDAAARALRQAIGALEQSGPQQHVTHHGKRRRGNNAHIERCIDIGFEAYKKAFDERYALDQAVKKCPDGIDANLLMLAFDAESKAFDDRVAFERAVAFGIRDDLKGKGTLLQLGFEAYRAAFDERVALRKAAEWAAPLRRRDESCIRRAFEVHRKSFDARVALDRAVKTCSK